MAGTSSYPGGIDDFALASPEDLGDVDSKGRTHSKRHDDIEAAVVAIETELGVNPSGSSGTVADRFGTVDAIAAAAAVSASAAANSAAAAANSAAVIDSYESLPVEFRQFGSDGSVLQNLATRVHPGEQLLKQAVWWIDSAHSSASGQAVTNLGWGGTALNAQLGSTGSADSNDPKYLDWTGENYVYLPGVSGNYLSVPDEAAFDMAGKTSYEVRVRLTRDDWTNGNGWIANCSNGNNGFRWQFLGGYFRFGTAAAAVNSTTTHGITSGSTTWVKAAWDATNVSFFTSANGTDWTQVGTAVAHGITWINPPVPMTFGGDGTSLDGKFHRMVYTVDGTPVLDIDTSLIASGAATSFTALTGQTVTINRSTSGRKAVAVVHPVWLLGTDDYLGVSDNALLDMGAATNFTVLAIVRRWATPNNYSTIIAKKHVDSTVSAGWAVNNYATSANLRTEVADGTNSAVRQNQADGNYTLGAISLLGMRVDRTAQTQQSISGSTLSSTTSISTVGSLDNSFPLRIGRDPNGTQYNTDMEFIAAAVFRRALTSDEISTITAYYSGRVGT